MRDDDRHPMLSNEATVGETRLDRLQAPKANLGNRQVREIPANQALTDFTMGGNVTGVAWSLNPYAGCHHACKYCYVPDTLHAERDRWGSYVMVKRGLVRRLEDEVESKDPRTVYLSTGTDPYQPIEAERELTRRLLSVLARHDWPVEVLTRNPLVLRDLDLLDKFTHLRVGMSVPTLDDEMRELLEPGAPAIRARLDTLTELARAGCTVFANYAPAYPLTGDLTAIDVAEAFAEAGVEWVNTSYWRRRGSIVVPIWDEVRGTEHEALATFIANREPQEELRAKLRDALARFGIPLHTAFYNPPFQIAGFQDQHKQLKLWQVPVEAAPKSRTASSTER